MSAKLKRRTFLSAMAGTAGCLILPELGLPRSLKLAGATPAPSTYDDSVPRESDIESLVRFLENTPHDSLIGETVKRIKLGLAYRKLLAALLLAGVRNIQPRPVGFKFHAVMAVNSVHLASNGSPEEERWLPLLWAIDYFKRAQAQDIREGDWTMTPVDETRLTPTQQARQAFHDAMARWDETEVDTSVTTLARSLEPSQLFETLCPYGARDYRDIGHKAIYMANGWRALEFIGFQKTEPVARSLAYAFLAYNGANPASSNAPADHPWRHNQALIAEIRPRWHSGSSDAAATRELLTVLRRGDHREAAETVVRLLNQKVSPQSIWDAIFCGAVELLMRRPGIVSLHAVTTTNGIHYAFRTSTNDATQRLFLLQNAAFLTLFRGRRVTAGAETHKIDELKPISLQGQGDQALADIFATVSRSPIEAAGKILGYLQNGGPPRALIAEARRLLVRKGRGPHDYKFTSAVLEDYEHVSPVWRDRFLAASVFSLRGLGDPDNPLLVRARRMLRS